MNAYEGLNPQTEAELSVAANGPVEARKRIEQLSLRASSRAARQFWCAALQHLPPLN